MFINLFFCFVFGFTCVCGRAAYRVKPVRRAGRPPRIPRRTRTKRATVRRLPRPPNAVAAAGGDGANGAGGLLTVGTRSLRRRRRHAHDRPRPRDPRRTIGTAARGARNRRAGTVRERRAAVCGLQTTHRRRTEGTVAGGAAIAGADAVTAAAVGWTASTSRQRPRPSSWSSCPCWPCRPATRCVASGRYFAMAEAHRRLRRWPVATRRRTGDAVAPPTDGGGDGGGQGGTAVDGAVLRDSGRGGTAVGGAGSVVAAADRTAPASPVRCRLAIRSTRCLCDWRPAGHRPRSIPCPSLYNLQTKTE